MKHVVYGAGSVRANSYANLVLLQRAYSQLEHRRWAKERSKFLNAEIKKNGKLVCAYCGKSDLKLKSAKRHLQATVDHVVPKSKGGDPFGHENFVVSCNSCNKKKASFDATAFKESTYIKRKTGRI